MGPANYVDNASLKLKAGGADCPFSGKSGENVEERESMVWCSSLSYGVSRGFSLSYACPVVFLGVSPTTEEALQRFLLPYRRTPRPVLREKSPSEVLISQQIRTIHVAMVPSQKRGYKAGGLVYAHDYSDHISQ